MYQLYRYLLIILLIGLLISVRVFEDLLFIDELKQFYLSDFQNMSLPSINIVTTGFYTTLRYAINSLISLSIIGLLYKKLDYIKAALWVYVFAYIILMTSFITLLHISPDSSKMIIFYIRRFLIHPLLLFVLTAGFYFLSNKKLVQE
ncbi:exosortase F system-associated membrane protein [Nonlabens sp. SY33080]|uniref:exosortase F system-associated membrane protein n=1 Tax=Nonlabens sp. SY33080 TaxID=2719911 RepID=UPI001428BABC|nr:exosortase F system-associated protein [Nonlabens sp. SY33080]